MFEREARNRTLTRLQRLYAPARAQRTPMNHVPLPPPSAFNTGLTSPPAHYMESVFSRPRVTFTAECQPVTNAKLKARMRTLDVGPFTVTCFDAFGSLLHRVFARVKDHNPELYDSLGSAGCLCARFMRGTQSISNHSYGLAIDLTVNGVLVPLGAQWTLQGLLDLYPYMHSEKIYSGQGYHSRPDAMHWEASVELIEAWRASGLV